MQSMYPEIMKLMTPEVFTVAGGIVMVYLGWKTMRKAIGMAKGLTGKFSLISLSAAALLMLSMSGATYSGSEVISRINTYRSKNKVEMPPPAQVAHTWTPDELAKIAAASQQPQVTTQILEFAREQKAAGELNNYEIAQLVTKTNPDNQQAMVEFLKLMQEQEGGKAKKAAGPISFASMRPDYSVYDRQEESLPTPAAEICGEADRTKNIPTAAFCGIFGLSLAGFVLAINTYNNRYAAKAA